MSCQSVSDSMLAGSCEEASTWVFSRLGAMESISSMKMMAGEFFSASSKAFRRLLSLSPASLDMISGPLIRKKKAPVSLATALAISVLPVNQRPQVVSALSQISSARDLSQCDHRHTFLVIKWERGRISSCSSMTASHQGPAPGWLAAGAFGRTD